MLSLYRNMDFGTLDGWRAGGMAHATISELDLEKVRAYRSI